MKILVTGAEGFIGKNLCVRLSEQDDYDVIKIDRHSSEEELRAGLLAADFIYHLAGVNRPKDDNEFASGNACLTQKITEILSENHKQTPLMLSSSSQATKENAYGVSKAMAEKAVEAYGRATGARFYLYRFPNVFGKWCRPNYNSFVATFCHNIINDIPITINDPGAAVTLVYIDDVCMALLSLLDGSVESGWQYVAPEYSTTVGEVADLLLKFRQSRDTLITEAVGQGFVRALYSTWLSYFRPEQLSYSIPFYGDARGVFCEVLKTPDAGQFSFFTALPGITRGGHYHHTKNEKFLVIKGLARFKFEHVVSGEKFEMVVAADEYKIVEMVPGWTHDITNIGNDEMIVMLWANEIFDRQAPDTIARTL
ncbi:UDP-2-acetamido-2,6-beta-L-arabino-hexul-4-ose reductase [Yersinia ruckeri]|uniref:NAD-dependent epimerase/dehydratase family protein n=1 Tax=Yersinia ruckeri TaxID=29486 RepID=A0A0A8V8R8_YERRU|nr:NAD-dependent epimerase/dehydratase family protein [Yersinia ruckeri]KGA47051.1 3-beta hydroxysteroid dehydrogenase/isomerase family protein [Yersinia ruckeri ATCC 29473]MCK8596238.1 NAD-dependent epimerase/dehydratase family protein [Yersinia ruckeri]MCK8599764.1 NAD-dependent epimerase/dehydratase family protein [Yersinia ruckeri]MCW6611915.1 NAD-dependent epimerase/dehydratase family protein [Yersinia ruckeri]MCW6618227.1 NAD-dependent epimerase/dehydratase family protein [Yersinia rucke